MGNCLKKYFNYDRKTEKTKEEITKLINGGPNEQQTIGDIYENLYFSKGFEIR
jgi:hypothetical protein